MKATFDIPENKAAAFALAALLAFGTFSILPISLTGVETKKVPIEYTKVTLQRLARKNRGLRNRRRK